VYASSGGINKVVQTVADLEIDDNISRIDFERVHQWLANSYWSPGVARERVEKAARNSAVVVGAYAEGRQVGYLRVVSDKTTFAWVCDVIVDDSFRGRGVGQAMVRYAQEHPELQGLRRWILATRDAHGVYEKCGFNRVQDMDKWMIYRPNPVPGVDDLQ
jgi:GNAT superfamily N-acetyltransferase